MLTKVDIDRSPGEQMEQAQEKISQRSDIVVGM